MWFPSIFFSLHFTPRSLWLTLRYEASHKLTHLPRTWSAMKVRAMRVIRFLLWSGSQVARCTTSCVFLSPRVLAKETGEKPPDVVRMKQSCRPPLNESWPNLKSGTRWRMPNIVLRTGFRRVVKPPKIGTMAKTWIFETEVRTCFWDASNQLLTTFFGTCSRPRSPGFYRCSPRRRLTSRSSRIGSRPWRRPSGKATPPLCFWNVILKRTYLVDQ